MHTTPKVMFCYVLKKIVNVYKFGYLLFIIVHPSEDGATPPENNPGSTLSIRCSKRFFVEHAQIVGMSATLSNIKDLQQFLKADVYTNDFRPVRTINFIL